MGAPVRHRRCSRRIARTLGAAAGGLLGVAFLTAAVAVADDYTVDPTGTETVTGIYGEGFDGADTAPPAVAGSFQGDQDFDYTDTTTGNSGEFFGLESSAQDGFGDTNEEIYVASDEVPDASSTDAPPVGSVFDTYTFDGGQDENIYSVVPSPTGDQITDILVTPSGDQTILTTFDAGDPQVVDAGGATIGNGDVIDPVGTQDITSISGIPPLTVALQGTQAFDLGGNESNLFDTANTLTTDGVGTYTEAVLVTQDVAGTAGTAAGDIPAVGSIFNTIDYGGDELVYSDLVGKSGSDVITDTLVTPYGDYDIPTTFDAADAETLSNNATIDLSDGGVITPVADSGLIYTGINGLPPVDVGVQGTQDFDYTDGTSSGTLTADVTNTLDMFDDSTETLLVTSSTNADLPAGSVIETVTWGDTGYESIYSDIASATGTDVASETLVSPFGDISLPASFDAGAGLATDFGT